MKAFIFDPLWDELITPELSDKLSKSGLELIITKNVAPLSENKALFEGKEDRILCLNPDYVGWKLAADDYKNIPNLKGIFGAATSTSWIDASFADANKIPICNIKNFSTEAVAEWAMTMMFNVARRIPELVKDGFPLDFDKDYMKYRGIEIHGKRAGIIGLGHIGSAIANRCAALGMEVVYWSRESKDKDFKHVELQELMSSSDFIFPTLAVNDETKGLVTDEMLGSMKASTILISVVHDLFNQDKVTEMVSSGKLFGFGFEAEPASFEKFKGNVWAVPAYAWATDQTMYNSMVLWIDNMINASKGEFPNRIN